MKLGLDPGISGALALLDGEEVLFVADMPVMEKTHGKGQQVNAAILADNIRHCQAIAAADGQGLKVYLEQVGAMPGQGVTSVFTFGEGFGVIKGVLGTLAVPYRLVRPQSWKKRAGLLGKEKDAARALAIQQHPEIADQLTRKKDGGRADAILIARFGE